MKTLTKLALATLIRSSSIAAQTDWVRRYVRSNGTYVAPHVRTRPNHTVTDNLSIGDSEPFGFDSSSATGPRTIPCFTRLKVPFPRPFLKVRTVRITRHAMIRSKERLGIPKRSVHRTVVNAIRRGFNLENVDDSRARSMLLDAKSGAARIQPILHGDHIYILSQSGTELVFLTVLKTNNEGKKMTRAKVTSKGIWHRNVYSSSRNRAGWPTDISYNVLHDPRIKDAAFTLDNAMRTDNLSYRGFGTVRVR